MKHSKAYKAAAEKRDGTQLHTPEQALKLVKEIAETKMPDLNANDIDAAMKIIEGTARQMGITVAE